MPQVRSATASNVAVAKVAKRDAWQVTTMYEYATILNHYLLAKRDTHGRGRWSYPYL